MRIIENTLEVVVEHWDDPGDYPSNAGAGPLPSTSELVLSGDVVVELTAGEILDLVREYVTEGIECPPGVSHVAKWDIAWQPGYEAYRIILTPTEVEFSED